MWRDLSSNVRRVKLGVGICRVAIATSPAAEHHVAAVHCALVHLPQVHSTEVDLQGTLVAECLQADIALDSLLSCGWIDKSCAQVLVESTVLPRAVVHTSSFRRHHVVFRAGHEVGWWPVATTTTTTTTTTTATTAIRNHVTTEIHWVVSSMAAWDFLFEFTLAASRSSCRSCYSSLVKLDHRMMVMIWSHEARHQAATE
jgi:hypothetical protein